MYGRTYRIVPRYDLPTHADRLAQRVCELIRTSVDDLAVHFVGVASIISKRADDFSNVSQGVAIWFSVVPSFNCGEGLSVLFDEGGKFEQETAAICGR